MSLSSEGSNSESENEYSIDNDSKENIISIQRSDWLSTDFSDPHSYPQIHFQQSTTNIKSQGASPTSNEGSSPSDGAPMRILYIQM